MSRRARRPVFRDPKASKKKQKIDDSFCCVYVVYGRPRSGKSYFFQELIYHSRNAGRQVVTNYPVMIPGIKKFDDKLLYADSFVYDSDIYIDEAYTFFNSRQFKNFTDHMHRFFSLCGHCGNRIYLISQHPARLDKVIREVTTYFIKLSCIRLGRKPLFFIRKYYDSDPCEFGNVQSQRFIRPVKIQYARFKKKIARTYNTHSYRSKEEPLILEDWVKPNEPF